MSSKAAGNWRISLSITDKNDSPRNLVMAVGWSSMIMRKVCMIIKSDVGM